MTEPLIFTVEEHIALLTLNRPDKRNAFTTQMLDLWAEALTECQHRPDIRVVVVTGAGQAFCAGGDIEEMQQRLSSPPLDHKRFLESVHRVPLTLAAMDKPVIAAVNGAAMGAGMDMALACDIRFASINARFAASYVRMGLAPGDGGAYFLPRLVGVAKALELLWTGDAIDAEKAEQLGIVNRVLPEEELMPYTREFAARLARGPEVAIRLTKRAVYESQAIDLRTSLDLISSHMAVLMATDDHHEAVQAFLEKRQPRFEGR
jgi:2-(1,2-epoxy-1,2-dihydrophenyl)acetyl-CoA isomerase